MPAPHTSKQFSVGVYDKKHLRNLSVRLRKVQALLDEAAAQAATIGRRTGFKDEGKDFHFDDFPQARREIDTLLGELASGLSVNVREGISEAWGVSNEKNDAMVDGMLGSAGAELPKKVTRRWYNHNERAMNAFIRRREEGMGLSENVWNLAQFKEELELALESGLVKGVSAAELSRDVRSCLRHPDKLFRRVRDERGVLRLSRAAQAYHPGRGVYRSSYKNALRLTATETNMAYRTADNKRWGQIDFVLGQHIEPSRTNHPVVDICDELKGDYPKDFKFVGWHPFCRCFAVPKMASPEKFLEYQQAILDGKDVSDWKWEGEVEDVPKNFKDWVKENEERIANAKSLPYFMKDNPKYVSAGTLGGKPSPATVRPARTAQQTQLIQDNWDLNRLERNQNLIPNELTNFAQIAIKNKDAKLARFVMDKAAVSMEETLSDYAIKLSKRSPVIDSMIRRLAEVDSKTGQPILTKTDRIRHIQKLKEKCAILTRYDLRNCKATEGLVFDRIDTEWSMGGGTVRVTATGKDMQIDKVRVDMLWFKDKNGKVFGYPIGATKKTIEFKASDASKIIDGLPDYMRDNLKGVVFVGRYHPLDKYYQVEYPSFTHGAAYSGDPITVHYKYSTKKEFKDMLCHETGHHIDLKAKFRYTHSLLQDWQNAVDAARLRNPFFAYPTYYAKTNAVEDFADSMMEYIGNKRDFKRNFPERTAIIERIIKALGYNP